MDDADPRLEGSTEPIYDPIRGKASSAVNPIAGYTKNCTPSADYPPIGQSWRRNWERLTPFFDFPPEIRKVIYTTNAIESVNYSLRKLTRHRGAFPSDEALIKLLYLAPRTLHDALPISIRDWKAALNQFTIRYEERLPQQ